MDGTSESNGAGESNLNYAPTDSELSPEIGKGLQALPYPLDVTPDAVDWFPHTESQVKEILKKFKNQDDKLPKTHPEDDDVVKLYLNNSSNCNDNYQNTLQNTEYSESSIDINNQNLQQPIPDQFNLYSPGLESHPIESSSIPAPAVATEKPGFGNLSEEVTSSFDNNWPLPNNMNNIQENPISSSNPSGDNAVPSSSSGTAVVKPEFELPATKPKPSTKRGRPPLKPVTPSREVLEKLSEEERRKLKNNKGSRESRKRKREQESQDELVEYSLSKRNKSLHKKKARLDEHLRLLDEEYDRVDREKQNRYMWKSLYSCVLLFKLIRLRNAHNQEMPKNCVSHERKQ